MKIKIKYILIVSAKFILIAVNNYYNSQSYFGWFTIIEKDIDDDNYCIVGYEANFNYLSDEEREKFIREFESVQIQIPDNYSFKYIIEDEYNVNEESVEIEDIWDSIQPNKSYFLLVHKNKFPWNLVRVHTIETFYKN